jgi:hypothetical protein
VITSHAVESPQQPEYTPTGRRWAIDYSEGSAGETVTFRYTGGAIKAEYVDGVLARQT